MTPWGKQFLLFQIIPESISQFNSHSLKVSTMSSLFANISSYKVYFFYSSKVSDAENTSLVYAGVVLAKGLKDFLKKGDPWLLEIMVLYRRVKAIKYAQLTYYSLQYKNYLPLSYIKSND